MVYKLITDLDSLDLNLFFEFMNKEKVDICLDGEVIYLHHKYDTTLRLDNIMKKMNITNFFLKEVVNKPSVNTNGFIYKWLFEKMSQDELETFERAHQKELQEMESNIQQARVLLKAQQENLKEVENGNGKGKCLNQEKKGTSKKNTCRRKRTGTERE